MHEIAKNALTSALAIALGAGVLIGVLYLIHQAREFQVSALLSAERGPADPAAWQVAQVIEEAREITRRAAEGDAQA